jgi:hypothetical protein
MKNLLAAPSTLLSASNECGLIRGVSTRVRRNLLRFNIVRPVAFVTTEHYEAGPAPTKSPQVPDCPEVASSRGVGLDARATFAILRRPKAISFALGFDADPIERLRSRRRVGSKFELGIPRAG